MRSPFLLGLLSGLCLREILYGNPWWGFLPVLSFFLGLALGREWWVKGEETVASRRVQMDHLDRTSASRKARSSRKRVSSTQMALFESPKGRVRLVRLTEATELEEDSSEVAIEGIEEHPPVPGKEYWIRTDRGTVFRTSPVVRVHDGMIETQHSLYRVERLDER